MIGIKFGRLTPIETVEGGRFHLMYLCECECGNKLKVTGNSLRNGNTKSCGCIRKPNLIGYKNDHGVVVEKIRNQVWKIKCNYCNEFHTQKQREIWKNAHSLRCKFYKPPNWSGLEKVDSDLRRIYGITLEQYNLLLNHQEGKCAICSKYIGCERKRINIDHDHNTNRVRGLLCNSCNTALGRLGDSVEGLLKAINYLENPPFDDIF
jgi:hypothetical protein